MVSKHVDLEGPVHYLDFGGDGPPLVCVHGLAGSALNWMAAAPQLARHYQVLAPDLRGFGRTPLGPGSRLRDNERLLDLFLRHVAGSPATLVGNSMGGLLSVRHAAKHPDSVRTLVLVDPALPYRRSRRFDLPVYASAAILLMPIVGERLVARRARRWGPERLVRAGLVLTCADPDRVPAELVRAHVAEETVRLLSPRSERALAQAARSLLRELFRGADVRTYQRVQAPLLIVHGDRDRLVPLDISLAIGQRWGWQVEVMPGVGHVPMMETPEDFARVALGWLETQQPAAA